MGANLPQVTRGKSRLEIGWNAVARYCGEEVVFMDKLFDFLERRKREDPELIRARERIEKLENERRLEILEKRRELMRRQFEENDNRDHNNT